MNEVVNLTPAVISDIELARGKRHSLTQHTMLECPICSCKESMLISGIINTEMPEIPDLKDSPAHWADDPNEMVEVANYSLPPLYQIKEANILQWMCPACGFSAVYTQKVSLSHLAERTRSKQRFLEEGTYAIRGYARELKQKRSEESPPESKKLPDIEV